MVGIERRSPSGEGEDSPVSPVTVGQIVESIVGCKWSLAVLGSIRAGVARPGEIERRCEGLSNKVMYERLRKLERYGLIQRLVYEAAPPHVEYRFTPRGERFLTILDAIEAVQNEFDGEG